MRLIYLYFVSDDLNKVAKIGELVEMIGTVRKDIRDDRITWAIDGGTNGIPKT